MPVLIPRQHTPHRAASLSLYRSLLRALPSAGPHQPTLRSLLRHRFARNTHLQSRYLLRIAFGSAQHVLSLLHDPSAATSIGTYLSTPASQALLAKLSAPPPPPNPRTPIFPAPDIALRRRPLALEDLRPKTPGTRPTRRIPVLYSANRFPVLRLDKPQPQNLSMYLSRLLQSRERRWIRMGTLEGLAEAGAWEDGWDAIVAGQGVKERAEGRWSDAGREAVRDVMGFLRRRDQLNVERARWYDGIVQRERALRDAERRERVVARRKRHWGRRRERWRREAEGKAKEADV